MSVQIFMDYTGDTRFEFDPADEVAVAKAMERFNESIRLGFTAAERTGRGALRKVTEFNPTATEVLFVPQLVGG
jgi:hypothetical protein